MYVKIAWAEPIKANFWFMHIFGLEKKFDPTKFFNHKIFVKKAVPNNVGQEPEVCPKYFGSKIKCWSKKVWCQAYFEQKLLVQNDWFVSIVN